MNLLFKGVKISEFHIRNFRGVFLQHLLMNKASIGSPWQFQLQRGAVALWPHTSVVGRPPRATPRRCGSLDGYKAWAPATEWARPGGFIGLSVPVVDFSILSDRQKMRATQTEKRKMVETCVDNCGYVFFLTFESNEEIFEMSIMNKYRNMSLNFWWFLVHGVSVFAQSFPHFPNCSHMFFLLMPKKTNKQRRKPRVDKYINPFMFSDGSNLA